VAGRKATGSGLRARAGSIALLELAGAGAGELCAEGRFAAASLTRWLGARPAGPLALGPESAAVLSALAEGWSSTAIHTAATRPLSAAEAGELAQLGLLAEAPAEHGEQRFAATEWLRRGLGPLAAAARLEIAEPREGAAPIDPLDVEAAFLLTLPLVKGLPEQMSSSCRLTVRLPERSAPLSGVVVLIERGEIASVTTDLTIWSDTYAQGRPLEWIEALIDPSSAALDAGGNLEVPLALLDGLHEELFSGLGEPKLRSG
jgi:hypothetical protein